jgi:DHA2 family multidrug resistance protein
VTDGAPGASSDHTASAHPPVSVAAETIAVMTVAMIGSSISSQLVDLDIADIGGALSVSADQASWIACAATMAEVASIPIAAILVRALSLRTVVLWLSLIYLACASGSLMLGSEETLIVARVMQSFCGGALSVLMFVAVMATLPVGAGRNIGLAIFGFASTAPTALNATVGAFVTERWNWKGLYYFDISWAVLLAVLAWTVLRPAPRGMRLPEIDWVGYVLLSIGLAALILFMKQGDRFFWLENTTITGAALIAALALPTAIAWFLWRPHPLIDLGLLISPTFGWAVSLATFYRFGMVMTAFVVPQALNIWMFWAECVAFPLAWLWASRGDARQPLSLGLALFAVGAFVSTQLTPQWQAGDIRLSLICIGLGQGLLLVPTLYYATREVLPPQGTTAAALFNLSRVVGQTCGTAVICSLMDDLQAFAADQ